MDNQPDLPTEATPAALKAARQWLLQFEWGANVVDLLDQPGVDTAQWLREADLMRQRIEGADSPPFA
jgi:hypothetical protein